MNKKDFAGLPANVVSLWDTNVIVVFHARNVSAVDEVKALGEPVVVMEKLAREASRFLEHAEGELGCITVSQTDGPAVAIRLECIKRNRIPVVHAGLYGLPTNSRFEVYVNDAARISEWRKSKPDHREALVGSMVVLWTSVQDPERDLPPGSAVAVERLGDGDYLILQFSGPQNDPPFMLYVEGAKEAERLIAESTEV